MAGRNEPTKLFGLAIKTFVLFLIVTSLVYFIWLEITSPSIYTAIPINAIVEMGMVFILPISLLLEAAFIVIYGIYRVKLRAWEIYVCSWYISVFVWFIVMWSIQLTSPPQGYVYPVNPDPSGSFYTGMTAIYTLLLLSLLTAAICTIVYTRCKKP